MEDKSSQKVAIAEDEGSDNERNKSPRTPHSQVEKVEGEVPKNGGVSGVEGTSSARSANSNERLADALLEVEEQRRQQNWDETNIETGPRYNNGGTSQFAVSKQSSVDRMTQGEIIIRDFTNEDSEAVRQICFSYFRSRIFPAVYHYLLYNGLDIFYFLMITTFFIPLHKVAIILLVYLLYLILRSRLEFERYLHTDCRDLRNIFSTYMINKKSHFWVCEMSEDPKDRKNYYTEKNDGSRNGGQPAEYADTRGKRSNALSSEEGDDVDTKKLETDEQAGGGTWTPFKNSFFNKSAKSTANREGKIAGCVGLVPYAADPSIAHLVRLVVASSSRRKRIGSRLFNQLELFARDAGYREIRLYINNLSLSSQRFARQSGFELVNIFPRGSIMRGDLMTWRKSLQNAYGHTTPTAANFVLD